MTEREVSSDRVSEERLERLIMTHAPHHSTYPSSVSCGDIVSMAQELLALRSSVKTETGRDALLAEVISLIEDDMYGPGEAEDSPDRQAFNKALRRQINRITSRLIVAPKLSAIESPAAASEVTEDWIRDTAMNVMLATEVEEAIRILTAALKGDRP